jgi:hypothetical protein
MVSRSERRTGTTSVRSPQTKPSTAPRPQARPTDVPNVKEDSRPQNRATYDATSYIGPGARPSEKPTKSAQLIADREAARRSGKK